MVQDWFITVVLLKPYIYQYIIPHLAFGLQPRHSHLIVYAGLILLFLPYVFSLPPRNNMVSQQPSIVSMLSL